MKGKTFRPTPPKLQLSRISAMSLFYLKQSSLQVLETSVVGVLRLVFPIRGKIKKTGFGQLRKETRVFSGFEMNAILSDKNSISL